MINRTLTYDKVLTYFQQLAENNIYIKKFVGAAPAELDNVVSILTEADVPLMTFFGYQGSLTGNKQRTLARRTISFAILRPVIDVNDFASQYAAIAEAEKIGLTVLSRINYDSRLPENNGMWLYNNFNKDAVRFSEVRAYKTVSLFGMEFHFDVTVPEPLIIEADDWDDIDKVC